EIGHCKQRVLLVRGLGRRPDLAEIAVIFHAEEEITLHLIGEPRRRREIGFAELPEADVDDRIDDEFPIGGADAEDGPDLQREPALRELWRWIAEFEIDAIEQ